MTSVPEEDLVAGAVYSSADIARIFGCASGYVNRSGPVIALGKNGPLLLAMSEIIPASGYVTFRGRAERERVASKRIVDLARNRRISYLFSRAGKFRYRYVSRVWCIDWHWDREVPAVPIFTLSREGGGYSGSGGGSDPYFDEDEYEGLEGRRYFVQHRKIERDARLVARAKAAWKDNDPLLRCSVCGRSAREDYGELGEGVIEAHHRVPLANLQAETRQRVTDLVPICSTCHRIVHLRRLTVEALRDTLRGSPSALPAPNTGSRPNDEITRES